MKKQTMNKVVAEQLQDVADVTLEDRFSQLEKRLDYLLDNIKVPSPPTDAGLVGSTCLNQTQYTTTQCAIPILKSKTYTVSENSLIIVYNRNTKTRATYQEYSAESIKQLISRLDITGCTVEIIPGNYPDLDNIRYVGND